MPPKAARPAPRRQPPKVALLIETSNAYARGLLAGIGDYVLGHGPWSLSLGEQGRGDRPPDWLARWDGDGIIARVENRRIARALAEVRLSGSTPRTAARRAGGHWESGCIGADCPHFKPNSGAGG